MRRGGRHFRRRLAIPVLGALVTAALALDFAWSQSSSRRPATEIPSGQTSADTLPEEIAPPAVEETEDYTVPLRQPSNGMLLDSADGLISLVARNASLQDVLAALAETQGLNLITQESVTAQLNTTLHRVPFEDALDVILSTSGYTWTRNRNVIQVTSLANAQPLAPETQGRRVEVFHLDYVSATDVNTVVQTMLSPAGTAQMIESAADDNRRTQETLVVQDLPGYLENIRNYVRRHDVPPRQVLVEAYILKVDLSNDMRHGINFDHVFNMSSNLFQIESRGLANAAATQGFMVNLSGGNLAAVVEMLENTSDAKTLASPKIRVLNGQTARIQVGEQLGFRVTTTTETSTTESVKFLDVGVVLEVTPRIGSDGTVIMRVSPEVSSGLVNPNTGLPEEKTTELQTDVMFRDNQAYVIGGLIQETDTDVQRKLPWLGDLRHVGHLFQRSEVIKARSEIIVALLPRVMPFDPVTHNNLQLETERATTPLLYGPLQEFPRPWETQLPHVVKNPRYLRLPSTGAVRRSKGDGPGLQSPIFESIEPAIFEAADTRRPLGVESRLGATSPRQATIGTNRSVPMNRLPGTNVIRHSGHEFRATSPSTMLR